MSDSVRKTLQQNLVISELTRPTLLQKLLPFLLNNHSIKSKLAMLSQLSELNVIAGKVSPTSDQINNNHVAKPTITITNGHGVHPYSKPSPPRRSPTPAATPVTPEQTVAMNGITNGIVNGTCATEQPDADFIKMFVGQIPRSLDEDELRDMFEEYGRVHQINVLRDKVTGQSKGCCFVTFYTRKAALDAQNALHNIKTLNGMHHPIQMKPADSENRNVTDHPYLSSAVSSLHGLGSVPLLDYRTAATNYYYLPSSYFRSDPMPPADEVNAERKLFVGMLAKKCSESDVRNMFSSFGSIEECTVLRDTNGQSKGCAFVTFATKQSAISAIKAMHHSQTMDGCSSALVVKFADTQKEKDQKKLQQMQASLWSLTGANLTPPYLANDSHCLAPASVQLLQHLAGGGTTPTPASVAPSLASLQQQLLVQQSFGLNLSGSPGLTMSGSGSAGSPELTTANLQNLATLANLSVASPAVNPMSVQNLVTLAAIQGSNNSSLQVPQSALTNLTGSSNVGTWSLGGNNGGGSPLSPVTLGSPLASLTSHNGTSHDAYSYCLLGLGNSGLPSIHSITSGAGKQVEGPDGANLFIYHLPPEFSDADLALTFHSFGNVISAKVFIDKVTNLSKCFGFVSYDNAMSAQSAIQAMNGFQIGMKRLKVQLKRSKEASRPY